MFFFFFFRDKLYNISYIKQAFKLICLDKVIVDGYFDMNEFLSVNNVRKDKIQQDLKNIDSKFKDLFENNYPKENEVDTVLDEIIGTESYESKKLLNVEAWAIVIWIYKIMDNKDEREKFTLKVFKEFKEFNNISSNFKFIDGVIYNADKIDVAIVNSMNQFNEALEKIEQNDCKKLFYRGHSNVNYQLKPSVKRTERAYENESAMYHELLINCPQSLNNKKTSFEKLVEMQHYGLPTRLLDITSNPLIALYFASCSDEKSYGEIVVFESDTNSIKYPNSDIVTVLSCLPNFKKEPQDEFKSYALNEKLEIDEFNSKIDRLIQQVRIEKPAFKGKLEKKDLLSSQIVLAVKENDRIIKQDGAFIICGLGEDGELDELRYRDKSENKKLVLLIKNKKSIMRSLDRFSINKGTLFPEIDSVADYIKNKYK